MTTTASRLITLIMLLQNRPNRKAAELAAELNVSVRTLHRYFAMLDEMGIPVYSERGPYGGFSLVRGYKLPPLVFTPEEATAVSLGTGLVEELWGDLYREAARGALAKLENVLPEAQREEVAWAGRTLVAADLHHPSLDAQAAILGNLRGAIRRSQPVEMVYQSASAAGPASRRLDPYALAFRWGWWYVVGFCHNHRDVRTFRIDRIREVTALDGTFQAPAGFDAQEFMAREVRGPQQVQARLSFAGEAVHIARLNRSYWAAFEEQPDGSIVVTMQAPDVTWAVSTILAYGPGVTVLEPEPVRQAVEEWARAILGNYSSS
ncbi:MAG TPA: YafY family protein [Anaerolineales bacterium]|nr:YafY family protein [Anaerolineales bacterium]